MWKLNYDPIFAEIIIDTFKNPKWRELFCEEIQRTLRDASQGAEDETEGLTLQFRESLAWFVLSMQKVAAGVQNDDLLGYETALSDYIQATCQWYDFMQEQGLTARLGEENPDYIEAALYISDYFETKETDVISALGLLKGAVEAFPTFAEGIGSFIHNYSDLETQRIAKQNEEMEALRVQVVGQVKAMLAAGQKEAAMQIIGQLKMMFPNDPEVNGL